MPDPESLVTLAADIVSAFVSNNRVSAAELPAAITTVHAALAGLGASPEPEEVKQEPAVQIRSSIKPDYIVCLEDGAKLKMLKRYLSRRYNMTPDEYRAKWKLPADYPMVAPNYSDSRRSLAISRGLGRKANPEAAEEAPAEVELAQPEPTPAAPKSRGRKPKAEAAPPADAATPAEAAPSADAAAPAGRGRRKKGTPAADGA